MSNSDGFSFTQPTSVHPLRDMIQRVGASWQRRGAGKAWLVETCRRMGTGLKAGLDIRRVCEQESGYGTSTYQRRMARISQQVNTGSSFSEAVESQADFFPSLFRAMVAVGERSGRLPEVLLKLSEHYKYMLELRGVYLIGILWPAIQLVMAVLIVGFMIWLMGPLSQFAGEKVDIFGFGLVGNRGLLIYIAFISTIVFSLWFVYRKATSGGVFTQWIQQLIAKVPVLGPAVMTLTISRMAWSMSASADTDMSARMIARTTLESSDNAVFSPLVDPVDQHIKQGMELHQAFRATGAFPDDFVRAIEIGEQSGTLVETLQHVSKDYEGRARTAWAALATVAAFMTWACIALIVIAMIFRVAMFYLNTIYGVLESPMG